MNDVDGTNWTALYAPKATPQPIIDKLNAEVVKILAMPDVKERFAAGGADTIPSTPAELDARVKHETAAFKTIVTRPTSGRSDGGAAPDPSARADSLTACASARRTISGPG